MSLSNLIAISYLTENKNFNVNKVYFYIDKNTQKHITGLQIKRKNKMRYF